MPLWQHYHRPKTVAEAIEFLDQHQGGARIIAGGTDLLLELQQGHRPPVEALIDVTAIAEMAAIDMAAIDNDNKSIFIGAAVPHSEIVHSDLIETQATCLVESCGVIGGPQVRNVGTLGGNVGHALPAADGTTALVVLNAEAEIAAKGGQSVWRPILSLYLGPGQSAVDQSSEIITRFRFPAAQPGEGSAFKRIMRPQGVALPILACAVWMKVPADDGGIDPDSAKIEDVRICVGPVRPVPCRAEQAEAALRGRSLAEALDDCVAAAQEEFSPRTSKHRATSEYREEMIEILLRRALPLAAYRAVSGEIVPEGIGLQ